MNAEKAILLPSRTRRASGKREETSGGWAVGSENQRRVRAPTCLPGETWVTGAAADTRLARPGSVSQPPVLHRRVQSGKSAVRVQQPVSASHSHWMNNTWDCRRIARRAAFTPFGHLRARCVVPRIDPICHIRPARARSDSAWREDEKAQ